MPHHFECEICLVNLCDESPEYRSKLEVLESNVELDRRTVVTAKCGHLTHLQCLVHWFNSSSGRSCPTCRTVVNDGELIKIFPNIAQTEINEVGLKPNFQFKEDISIHTLYGTLLKDYNEVEEKYKDTLLKLDDNRLQIAKLRDVAQDKRIECQKLKECLTMLEKKLKRIR